MELSKNDTDITQGFEDYMGALIDLHILEDRIMRKGYANTTMEEKNLEEARDKFLHILEGNK